MPAAQQVARQPCGQVEAVKVPRLRSIVRDGAADQGLGEKQQGRHQHELERCRLGRRDSSSVRGGLGNISVTAMPAEVIEFAEGEQHDPDAAQ